MDLVIKLLDDVLSNVEDQMDTLLGSDSSYEGKEWDAVIQITELEIFLLKILLGSFVVWSAGIELLNSLRDWNTIWEGEWMRLLSQEPSEA